MPYKVVKRNGHYNIYKEDAQGKPTGNTLGSHPTRGQANAQLRALYANVKDAAAKVAPGSPSPSEPQGGVTLDTLQAASPDIIATADALIAAHFPNLANAAIAFYERPSTLTITDGDSHGQIWAATTIGADVGMDNADFVTWVAANVWAALDGGEREALLYHELSHMGVDANGALMLNHHDAEIFDGELEYFGMWWIDANARVKAASAAGAQEMAIQQKVQEQGMGGMGGGMMVDPHLQDGADFHGVDLGNGNMLALCPDCYAAAKNSILADAQAAQAKPMQPRVNWNSRVNWGS